jgi:tetratricopeptide (TPR) repeat protein
LKGNYQLSIINYQLSISNCQSLVKSFILALVIFLIIASLVLAQSPSSPAEAMLVANQRYELGNYDEAIAGYEAIIASGVRNSDVYYNLGNAYFKQGDTGRAILNYRRAQQLDPPDADIAANLALARAQTVDKLEVPPEGVLINIVEIAEEWLTLNQAAMVALGLWLLMCVAFVVAIFQPRWRRLSAGAMVILGILLLIGLVSMANRLYKETQSPAAVIVAPQVDVTSGPGGGDQYLVEFELHAGAEVRLLESRIGWRRITLPGNLEGWVPGEAIEPVIDQAQN